MNYTKIISKVIRFFFHSLIFDNTFYSNSDNYIITKSHSFLQSPAPSRQISTLRATLKTTPSLLDTTAALVCIFSSILNLLGKSKEFINNQKMKVLPTV